MTLPSKPFEWSPGQGYDPEALARLREAFPRPRGAMGEAWFMAEVRRTFPELAGDLDAIPVERLQQAITEIVTGTSSFGDLDHEWRDWFHYLLPRLVPRSHEAFVDQLLEILASALFALHPTGLESGPYRGFREDVLATLGRCQMDAVCWPGGELAPEICLNRSIGDRPALWTWDDASGALSASMFLCVKYLRPDEVGTWLRSVLAIDQPRWRAQVMVWLLGAHPMLTGAVYQPSAFSASDYPQIGWAWSHCLNGDYSGVHGGDGARADFIPEAHRRAVLDAVRSYFREDVFLEWLASFAADPQLETELASTPYWFFELYGPAPEA